MIHPVAKNVYLRRRVIGRDRREGYASRDGGGSAADEPTRLRFEAFRNYRRQTVSSNDKPLGLSIRGMFASHSPPFLFLSSVAYEHGPRFHHCFSI